MNTEYGGGDNYMFLCYANKIIVNPKRFVINGQFDFIEFWLTDSDGKKVDETKIKDFRVEMILETN
jgi:hypothetical protein